MSTADERREVALAAWDTQFVAGFDQPAIDATVATAEAALRTALLNQGDVWGAVLALNQARLRRVQQYNRVRGIGLRRNSPEFHPASSQVGPVYNPVAMAELFRILEREGTERANVAEALQSASRTAAGEEAATNG